MAAKRLHVTLLEAANLTSELPQPVLDGIKAVAALPRLGGPFSLAFDRLQCFNTHAACVLTCTAEARQKVLVVRDQLVASMKQQGLRPSSVSTPHMTAYYDSARVTGNHPIQQMTCSACHLSLLLSYQGCTEHALLGEWPL